MFRLDTNTRQPGISSSPSMNDKLCRLARDTEHPSITTLSSTATGAISPVREGVHSISRRTLSYNSSSNLKASPSLKW